jgi:hypothetical protein
VEEEVIVVVGAKSVVRGAVLLAVAGGKENGLGGQLCLQLLSQLREVWPLHWQYLATAEGKGEEVFGGSALHYTG